MVEEVEEGEEKKSKDKEIGRKKVKEEEKGGRWQ